MRSLAMLVLASVPFVSVPAADRLRVEAAWSRATPPGATVAGGFLTLHNDGVQAERLLGASSDAAASVEIHSVTEIDGVMRMRRLDDGLAIPAGERVTLAPGGYHLMFIRPSRAFAAGDTVDVRLQFEHAGEIPVAFTVRGADATGSDPHAHHRH